MWRRLLIIGLVFVPVALILGLLYLPDYMVGVHQRSVTRSLSDWKVEYSNIDSQLDAVRTAEMLEYVQSYYVPAGGYRSTEAIESALYTQRQETIYAFVLSLLKYTNEDFGKDSEKWLAYLQSSTPIDHSRGDLTDFSNLVDTLSAEHSRDEALAAHRELVDGGKQAFPTLLKRMDDETITHIEFLGSVSTTDPPPIGQVCFEILQMQIEGQWPKGFRSFHVLNKTNIAQWVKTNSSQSLAEMRRTVLTQAIRNIELRSGTDLGPNQATRLLDFLHKKWSLVEEPKYVSGSPTQNPFE